jgi:3-oxoacyl-[acyl-carrier protein] reductase
MPPIIFMVTAQTETNQPPVALVTGAAGGLGRGIVSELLAQGWRVAAGWHSAPDFAASESLMPVALDVTRREQAAAAVAETVRRWGRLDLLVNNAGITRDQALPQISADDWDAVVDTNLKGAFLCSQAALKPMLQQRDGHIINLSSHAGRNGSRGQANYAAAKAGLLALTTSLAREIGGRNVRVNAILPGVLRTGMTRALSEAQLDHFARANALGRLNDIAEVARFIVFLAGLRNISGQIFQLDSRISRWT